MTFPLQVAASRCGVLLRQGEFLIPQALRAAAVTQPPRAIHHDPTTYIPTTTSRIPGKSQSLAATLEAAFPRIQHQPILFPPRTTAPHLTISSLGTRHLPVVAAVGCDLTTRHHHPLSRLRTVSPDYGSQPVSLPLPRPT